MKTLRLMFVLGLMLVFAPNVWAIKGVLATDQDIQRLKDDLRSGKVTIGKTRFNEIRQIYGDASEVTVDEKKVVYEYGDLRLEFDKIKYWKDWTYDTFKSRLYTPDITKLTTDLENKVLTGNNVTADTIIKTYGTPTEVWETEEDGEITFYYYGSIRLAFENYTIVKKWKGKNLAVTVSESILGAQAPAAAEEAK